MCVLMNHLSPTMPCSTHYLRMGGQMDIWLISILSSSLSSFLSFITTPCYLKITGFSDVMLCSLEDPATSIVSTEAGDRRVPQNIGTFLQDYTALNPERQYSSWEPATSRNCSAWSAIISTLTSCYYSECSVIMTDTAPRLLTRSMKRII
jgi:hypothetical protein